MTARPNPKLTLKTVSQILILDFEKFEKLMHRKFLINDETWNLLLSLQMKISCHSNGVVSSLLCVTFTSTRDRWTVARVIAGTARPRRRQRVQVRDFFLPVNTFLESRGRQKDRRRLLAEPSAFEVMLVFAYLITTDGSLTIPRNESKKTVV